MAPQFVDLALKIINGRFDRAEPKTGRRTRLSGIAEEAVENALPLASGGWTYPIWTLIETTTLPKTLTETCARTVAQAFSISISAHFHPASAGCCIALLLINKSMMRERSTTANPSPGPRPLTSATWHRIAVEPGRTFLQIGVQNVGNISCEE